MAPIYNYNIYNYPPHPAAPGAAPGPYPGQHMNGGQGIPQQFGVPYPAQHMSGSQGMPQQFRAQYPVQHMNGGHAIPQPNVGPRPLRFPPQQMHGGAGVYNAGGAPPQHFPPHQVNATSIHQQVNGGHGMYNAGGAPLQPFPLHQTNAGGIQQQMNGGHGMYNADGAAPYHFPLHQTHAPSVQQQTPAPPAVPRPSDRQKVIEIDDDAEEVVFEGVVQRSPQSSPKAHATEPEWTAKLPPAPATRDQPEWASRFSFAKLRKLWGKDDRRFEGEDREMWERRQQMMGENGRRSKKRKAEAAEREERREEGAARAAAESKAQVEETAGAKRQQEVKMKKAEERAAEQKRRQNLAAARPLVTKGGLTLPGRAANEPPKHLPPSPQPAPTRQMPRARAACAATRAPKTWTPTCSIVQAVGAARTGRDNASMGIVFLGVPNILAAINQIGLRHGFANMGLCLRPDHAYRALIYGSLQHQSGCWTYESLYRSFGFANADEQDKWTLPDFATVPLVPEHRLPTVPKSFTPSRAPAGGLVVEWTNRESVDQALNDFLLLRGAEKMQLMIAPDWQFSIRIDGHYATRNLPMNLDWFQQQIFRAAQQQGVPFGRLGTERATHVNAPRNDRSDDAPPAEPHATITPNPPAPSPTPTLSGTKRTQQDSPACGAESSEPPAKRIHTDKEETTLPAIIPLPSTPSHPSATAGKRKCTDEPKSDQPIPKRPCFERRTSAEPSIANTPVDSVYSLFGTSPDDGEDELTARLEAALAEAAAEPENDELTVQLEAALAEDHTQPYGEQSQVASLDEADGDIDYEELFGSSREQDQSDVNGAGNGDASLQTSGTYDNGTAAVDQGSESLSEYATTAQQPDTSAAHNESVDEPEEPDSDSDSDSDSEDRSDSNDEDTVDTTAGMKTKYRIELALLEDEVNEAKRMALSTTDTAAKDRGLEKAAAFQKERDVKQAILSLLEAGHDEQKAIAKTQCRVEIAELKAAIKEKEQQIARSRNKVWNERLSKNIEKDEKVIAAKRLALDALCGIVVEKKAEEKSAGEVDEGEESEEE